MSTINKMIRRAQSCIKGIHNWCTPDGRPLSSGGGRSIRIKEVYQQILKTLICRKTVGSFGSFFFFSSPWRNDFVTHFQSPRHLGGRSKERQGRQMARPPSLIQAEPQVRLIYISLFLDIWTIVLYFFFPWHWHSAFWRKTEVAWSYCK